MVASEARELTNRCNRLINIIDRNIKEEASMGRDNYTFEGNISDEALKVLTEHLETNGYTVVSSNYTDDNVMPNSETISTIITIVRIKW